MTCKISVTARIFNYFIFLSYFRVFFFLQLYQITLHLSEIGFGMDDVLIATQVSISQFKTVGATKF